MNNVELTDFEVKFILALLGNTVFNNKVTPTYNKFKELNGGKPINVITTTINTDEYLLAIDNFIDESRNPLEKLLIKYKFNKNFGDNKQYYLCGRAHTIRIDAENGKCDICYCEKDFPLANTIKTETDIKELLYSFGPKDACK